MKAIFVLETPESTDDQIIEVAPGEILRIGREPHVDQPHLVIDSPYVSLKHAEIHCSDNATTIVDFGSAFGTWVNKKQLNKNRHCVISSGDVLKLLGNQKLVVRLCPTKEEDGRMTQSTCHPNVYGRNNDRLNW